MHSEVISFFPVWNFPYRLNLQGLIGVLGLKKYSPLLLSHEFMVFFQLLPTSLQMNYEAMFLDT